MIPRRYSVVFFIDRLCFEYEVVTADHDPIEMARNDLRHRTNIPNAHERAEMSECKELGFIENTPPGMKLLRVMEV